ncbi:sensor histidine kinase [Amaricoccus solimangrovi]|uniref:histidine kinase n=1 Tax=Amaricoccus solimangrovi TaxID=2589815 RepID=A0A501WU06_9RHOB|nr:HAMP domain-containing sensor histidine kinase [Amaricoccus solimangrovi]TPE50451.1 HAMP domain-containing histidine kinase [Amaricoccus solimangrovi]
MFFNTLSRRFLGLAAIFLVIVEALFFVPAVSRFRQNYLQNQLELSQQAALAVLATPGDVPAPDLEKQLLDNAQVLTIALRRPQVREMALRVENPPRVSQTYDLTAASDLQLARAAMRVFLVPGNRVIMVIGQARQSENVIEITMYEGPLRAAMVNYALRILYTSLAISIGVALLMYLAVRWFIVRPVRRVVANMSHYRANPEDAGRVIEPRSGAAELREAEAALRDLQIQLTALLRQKDRLAQLGGAVAKISHDLRNLLTTAQLLADRIEMSSDPAVKRSAPKLVNSLSRAIALCERTLAFGRAEEPPPTLETLRLAPLIEEVVHNECLLAGEKVSIRASVAPEVSARADADQLFRVLTNLVRNAAQAIDGAGKTGEVVIAASREGAGTVITVADTGPGLPPKARENLFQPFRGGARQGGSGLGLVIASEIAKGHGGSLGLASTGPEGTVFRLYLPDAS